MEVRNPHEQYVAPQCLFSDAVIRIAFSKYGREVSEERNVYRVTHCQSRLEKSIGASPLSIDLFAPRAHRARLMVSSPPRTSRRRWGAHVDGS